MVWSSAILLGLVQLTVASPLAKRWTDLVEKHSWVEIPRGWEFHSVAPQDHQFDMRIGLKQNRINGLIQALYEVSDPTHDKYGAHLSKEEVEELVAPHPDSVQAVESWLADHNINPADAIHRSGAGDWVTLRVTVAQAEKMLGAKYNVYHHAKSSDYVVRTLSYSLPRELHAHIHVVAPTTYFGTMRSMRATNFLQPEIKPLENEFDVNNFNVGPVNSATVPAGCSPGITPACLRALYKTVDYVPKATHINKLGVTGYLNEFASRADYQTFMAMFHPDATKPSFNTTLINGGLDDQSRPGVEAGLDIQYASAISFPTPNIYYSTGGSPPFIPDTNTPRNTNEPYIEWLSFILNQTDIPQTFTTSYGDDEQTVPVDYQTAVCNAFAQLGARGSSVLFSSGDYGVGGKDCMSNDGSKIKRFQPDFPASCPFITSVGGTTHIPETAVGFSGGGFSRTFSRPAYQNTHVSTYLSAIGNLYSGLYNPSGRGYPDVAAQGSGFQVVVRGRVTSVGGTSASVPTVAAIVSLLNDFRISNGKRPLGFLNPLLYSSLANGFNDIVSGCNPGCGTNGFPARPGWDPVTGLGTPDFAKLQTLVAQLP